MEESEVHEEDSHSKERRIRKVSNFKDDEDIDVGNEGNKSTYLRPSKNIS